MNVLLENIINNADITLLSYYLLLYFNKYTYRAISEHFN
jgi:hypothetical protein